MARLPVIRYVPGSTTLITGRLYWYVYEGVRFTLKAIVSGKPAIFSHSFFENTSPQTLWYETEEQAESFNPTLFPNDRVKIKTGQRVVNTEDSPRTYLQLIATPFVGTEPLIGYINEGTNYQLDVYAPFISDGYNMQNRILPVRSVAIGKISPGQSVTVTVTRKRLNSTQSSNDYLYVSPTGYTLNYVTAPDTTSGDNGLFLFSSNTQCFLCVDICKCSRGDKCYKKCIAKP